MKFEYNTLSYRTNTVHGLSLFRSQCVHSVFGVIQMGAHHSIQAMIGLILKCICSTFCGVMVFAHTGTFSPGNLFDS